MGFYSSPKPSTGTGASGYVSAILGEYKIDANTITAGAATGYVRYNNATQTSATAIYINEESNAGVDITLFLQLLAVGAAFVIQDQNDHANIQQFQITSAPVDNGTYWTIPVSFVSSAGTGTTGFANNHVVFVAAFNPETDEKVKVSANDTTEGYLNGKLVAGTGITFTENNDGGNETLTVALDTSTTDGLYLKLDQTSPQSVINGAPTFVAGINSSDVFTSGGDDAIFVDTGELRNPSDGSRSVDWLNRILYYDSFSPSVDWGDRLLVRLDGTTGVDWQGDVLNDTSEVESVRYSDRELRDSTGTGAFDWSTANALRILAYTTNGFVKTSGANGTLTIDTSTYLTSSAADAAYLKLDQTSAQIVSNGTPRFASGISVDSGGGSVINVQFSRLTLSYIDGIVMKANGVEQVEFIDGAILPLVSNDIDLGSSTKLFKNGYFDGDIRVDKLVSNNVPNNTSIDVSNRILHDDDGTAIVDFGEPGEVYPLVAVSLGRAADPWNEIYGTDYYGTTGTFTGDITVQDEAYGVGWNGSTEVPTKNAIYDKIEALAFIDGSGAANQVAYWSDSDTLTGNAFFTYDGMTLTLDVDGGGTVLAIQATTAALPTRKFDYGADGFAMFNDDGSTHSFTLWDNAANATNMVSLVANTTDSWGGVTSNGNFVIAPNGELVASATDAPFWFEGGVSTKKLWFGGNNGFNFSWDGSALMTASADIAVPDEAYGVSWNGSLEVPTKNAIYDQLETFDDTERIYLTLGNGVDEIVVGTTAYSSPVSFAGTITEWRIVEASDPPVASSIVIDVWKDVTANYPPTVADTIAGTEKPTLSSAKVNSDTALSSWTTSVAVGDIFGFYVDSCSGAKKIILQITVEKT